MAVRPILYSQWIRTDGKRSATIYSRVLFKVVAACTFLQANKIMALPKPMLLKLIRTVAMNSMKHRESTRLLLVLAAPLTLLNTRTQYSMRSNEFLYGKFDAAHDLLNEHPTEFVPGPPHQTICVVLDKARDDCDAIIHKVKRLKLRTRSVVVTHEDISETFFAKIYIRASSHSHVNVHPARGFQPDNDILVLALKIFGGRCKIGWRDLVHRPFENAIDLSLANGGADHQNIVELLKYLMNVEAFTWCNFFYVPFSEFYVRAEPLVLFIAVVFLLMLYECRLSCDPVWLVLAALLCHFIPPSFILFARRGHAALYTLIFVVINFRAAFLFCILFYIGCVSKEIRKRLFKQALQTGRRAY